MKKRVFSALSALLVVGFLAACAKEDKHPGIIGFASGVTSIGDGKVVVSRNEVGRDYYGNIVPLRNLPPFVIDCTREKSPFC